MSAGRKYVVGVSGASGSPYAAAAIKALLKIGAVVHVIFTPIAKQVWQHEMAQSFHDFINSLSEAEQQRLIVENNNDLGASISSGSFRHDGMLVYVQYK